MFKHRSRELAQIDMNSGASESMVTLPRILYWINGVSLLLSVVAISPWHYTLAGIWTQPKVSSLAVFVVSNLLIIFANTRRGIRMQPNRKFYFLAGLLGLTAAVWLLAASLAPFTARAIAGDDRYGTSGIYFLLIIAVLLTNAMAIALAPKLIRIQLKVLILAGVIFALALFPQVVDWRIDYTSTSGQVTEHLPDLLTSGIYAGQMPIALSSHRGRAGAVLVLTAVLGIVMLLHSRRRYPWILIGVTALISVAVWFTDTRGVWLAYIVGAACALYFSGQGRNRAKAVLMVAAIVALSAIPYVGVRLLSDASVRNMPSASQGLNRVSSGRLSIWETAWEGFLQRPVLGWGFDGFGIVSVVARSEAAFNDDHEIDFLDSYTARVSAGNQERVVLSESGKAHNIFLDLLVSNGLVGTVLYLAAFAFAVRLLWMSGWKPLMAAIVAYWVFLGTWFDAAQYAHLQWLLLSIPLAQNFAVRTAALKPD